MADAPSKKRAPNFSENECLFLADIMSSGHAETGLNLHQVNKHRFTSQITSQTKKDVWACVEKKFNAETCTPRTAEILSKKWDNLVFKHRNIYSDYRRKQGQTAESLLKKAKDLSASLENRTFVDYFNTFLCLPVFGQHVIYNYTETEFKFEPPIEERGNLYLDPRQVLYWLCAERVPLFRRSALYTEYGLCMKLKSAEIDLPGIKQTDPNGETQSTFTQNLIGTVTGMMLFRESLRGTNGEQVYRCWKDIEAWKLIEEPGRKMYWKRAIKTKYISQNSRSKVKGSLKVLAFQGSLNFGLVGEDAAHSDQRDIIYGKMEVHCLDTDEALLHVQIILFRALRKYWLPRYIIQVLKITSKRTLDVLKRPVQGETEYMDLERKLKSKYMFPTIYQDTKTSSSNTSVYASKSTGDLQSRTPTPQEEPDYDFDEVDIVSKSKEDKVDPVHLLSIWGGPSRQIKFSDSRSSSSLSYFSESSDDFGRSKIRSRSYSVASNPSRSTVPIEVKSFLGGKKRTLLGQYPNTSNRIVWSLASDILAACPFRTYLQLNDHFLDVNYLSFWSDIRSYLDADEHAVNEFGQPLRRALAQGILQKYLSRDQGDIELFSEALKKDLCEALMDNTDVSLLCMAQDIVQESLWEPLKLFMEDERKRFMAQVKGKRYGVQTKQRMRHERLARKSKSSMSTYEGQGRPSNRSSPDIDGDSRYSVRPPMFSPTNQRTVNKAKSGSKYPVCITIEQMWKATELAILCCEFGSPMIVPQYPPSIHQLVDINHNDYGSLHVARTPAIRNKWLRNLVDPPKIDIEAIRVSREVCLDEIDMNAIRDRENAKHVVRRNGMVIERPPKPRSFIEVLITDVQFDFFKRFMMAHKMLLPLMFWKAVEDLKDLVSSKTRQMRVPQILRTFFGKNSKPGAMMDCHEEIIRQIPKMDKVTPAILICAQAAVFRSLERKWYSMYLDTYPPEPDLLAAQNKVTIVVTPQNKSPELVDIVDNANRLKEKYAGISRYFVRIWRKLTRFLVEFHKSFSSKHDVQLLEIFLKCEMEKEQAASLNKEHVNNKFHPLEKNMMLSTLAHNKETRLVIRNRLVLINRLPADLRFWVEVRKFQDLVDSTSQRGSMSALDAGFVYDKAASIISCYLSSDVLPKVQINIPNDMAHTIINTLAYYGPIRGLFHEAIVLLFPVLYHYYRKFQNEVLNGDISDEYLETFEKTMRYRSCTNPHPGIAMPDFKSINADDVRVIHQDMDEHTMKINFSLADGITHIYPTPKAHKVNSNQWSSRRMTKHSIQGLTDDTTTCKASMMKQTPEERGDGRHTMKGGVHYAQSRGDHHSNPSHKPPPVPPKQKEAAKKQEKVKVLKPIDSKCVAVSEADKHMSERARRLSALLESMNKEKQKKKSKENKNKKFKYVMSFAEVVREGLSKLSNSSNMFE